MIGIVPYLPASRVDLLGGERRDCVPIRTGDLGLRPASGGDGAPQCASAASLCFSRRPHAVGIIKQSIGPARQVSPATSTEIIV